MISVVTPWRTLLSAFGLIGRTKSEWVLMSMKPGVTVRPSATMTFFASPARDGPSAAMRPSAIAISLVLPGLAAAIDNGAEADQDVPGHAGLRDTSLPVNRSH